MEAPQTEYIYQNHINEPVVVIAAGFDWNQPYSCLQWGTEFGLTYPILDDITDIYSLFGVGYIPHHVIIGGDGEVLYSASGCLLYTSPSPRDLSTSRMPSSA